MVRVFKAHILFLNCFYFLIVLFILLGFFCYESDIELLSKVLKLSCYYYCYYFLFKYSMYVLSQNH